MRLVLKKFFFATILLFNFVHAADFVTMASDISRTFWRKYYGNVVSDTENTALKQNIIQMVNGYAAGQVTEDQKADLNDMLSRIPNNSNFSAGDRADYASYQSSLLGRSVVGAAASASTGVVSTGYLTIQTRIANLTKKVAAVKALTDFASIITDAQVLASEIPGAQDLDRKNFLITIDSALSRLTVFLPVDDTAKATINDAKAKFTSLKTKASSVSDSDRIAFLERINNGAFVDQQECGAFMNILSVLRSKITTLSNDLLLRINTVLQLAYSGGSFSADQKLLIYTVASELADYYYQNLSGGSSAAAAEGNATSTEVSQDNFVNVLNVLKTKFTELDSLYKQGTQGQAQAIAMKRDRQDPASFYPMADKLASFIGDMITADYKDLPSIRTTSAAGTATDLALPALNGGLVDEQALAANFFDIVPVSSSLFVTDAAELATRKKAFAQTVTSGQRLAYLLQVFGTVSLSSETKKRFIWHLQYLVVNLSSTSMSKALSQAQLGQLSSLLNALVQNKNMSEYVSHLQGLVSAYNVNVRGAATGLLQGLNGRQVAICLSKNTTKVLGAIPAATSSNQVILQPKVGDNYYLDSTQSFFVYSKVASSAQSSAQATTDSSSVQTASSGSTASTSSASSDGSVTAQAVAPTTTSQATTVTTSSSAGGFADGDFEIYFKSNANDTKVYYLKSEADGSLSFVLDDLNIIKPEYIFSFKGSSLDDFRLVAKNQPSSFVTYFDSGVLSSLNPISMAPMSVDVDNQHLKMVALSDFELALVAAKKVDESMLFNTYTTILGMATDNTTKQLFLGDVDYTIKKKAASGTLSAVVAAVFADKDKGILPKLLLRSDFGIFQKNISDLLAFFSSTSISGFIASGSGSTISAPTSDQKYVFSFGDAGSSGLKYLTVKSDSSKFYIKAAAASSIEPVCQFKLSQVPGDTTKYFVESAAYPGYFLAYDPSRLSEEQDMNLLQKTASDTDTTKFQFYFLKSSQVPGRVCLRSIANGGFLTIAEGDSLLASDFINPWAESASSSFNVAQVDAFYTGLAAIFNSTSSTTQAKLDSLRNFATISNINSLEKMNVFLRSVYFWLLSFRVSPDAWTNFYTQTNVAKLKTLISTISTKSFVQLITPFMKIVEGVSLFSNFALDQNLSILPLDRALWLSESDFAIATTGSACGLSFAFAGGGSLVLDLVDAAKLSPVYKFVFGTADNAGNYTASLLKNNKVLASGVCSAFSQNDYNEFAITLDNGKVSVNDSTGLIFQFVDEDYLKSFTSKLMFGLSAQGSVLAVPSVSPDFSLYYISLINSMIKEDYSAGIASRIAVLTTETTLSDKFNKALADLETVYLPFQKKFIANDADLKAAADAIASAQGKAFAQRFTPKAALARLSQLVNQAVTKDQYIAFINSVVDAAMFYKNYPSKDDNVMKQILSIISKNIRRYVKLIYTDEDKTYFSEKFIPRLQSAQIFDAGQIQGFADSLMFQIQSGSGQANANLTGIVSQLQQMAASLQDLDQRAVLINYVLNAIMQIKSYAPEARASMSDSINGLRSFILSLKTNTFFKDILGQLEYLNYVITNFKSYDDVSKGFLVDVDDSSKAADALVLSLNNFVMTLGSWFKMGFDPVLKSQIKNNFAGMFTTLINNKKAKLGSYAFKLNFLNFYLNFDGDLSAFVDDVVKSIPLIKTADDKALVLARCGACIDYIEAQIAANSLDENDRAKAKSLVAAIKKSASFADSGSVATIFGYENRLNAVADPFALLDSMTKELPTISSSDNIAVDSFISRLTDLSNKIKDYVSASSLDNSVKIKQFNDFIDMLITNSNTKDATGVYFALFNRRNYNMQYNNKPNIDFAPLKIDTTGDLALIGKMKALATEIDTVNLADQAMNKAFVNKFTTLVNDWKLAVIFDPSKHSGPNTTFNLFYDSAKVFFDKAFKNFYLAANSTAIADAKADMIDDKFTLFEKIETLQTFVTSGIKNKTSDDILAAAKGVIDEFVKYRNLYFDMPNSEQATVVSFLDFLANNSALSAVKTQLGDLKTSISTLPSVANKVDALVAELGSTLGQVLSDTQKANIVNLCLVASNRLKLTSDAELKNTAITALKNLVNGHVMRSGFDNSLKDSTGLTQLETMTNLLSDFKQLDARANSSSAPVVATTPTTTPSNVATVGGLTLNVGTAPTPVATTTNTTDVNFTTNKAGFRVYSSKPTKSAMQY